MARNRYRKKDGSFRAKYSKNPRTPINKAVAEANDNLMATLTDEWELGRTWTEFSDHLYVADSCYLYLIHKETGICKNSMTEGCWYSDRDYVIQEDSNEPKKLSSMQYLLEVTENWWSNVSEEDKQACIDKLEEGKRWLEEYEKKKKEQEVKKSKAMEIINTLRGWEHISTRFAELLPEYTLVRKEYGTTLCYCVGLGETWVKIPVNEITKMLTYEIVEENREVTGEDAFKWFIHHLVKNNCYGLKKYNKRERKHLNQWKKIERTWEND